MFDEAAVTERTAEVARDDTAEAVLDEANVRSLTIMNLSGDSTLVWAPANDALMHEIIQKKLDEGFVFHILEERFVKLLPARRVRVTDVAQAMASRKLVMADELFASIVGQGSVQLVRTPDKPGGLTAGGTRRSTDAAEIASRQSVGVRQLAGG